MLFLPLGAFLYLVSTGINTGGGFGELSTDYYGYAYLIYWIPIVPACALITNLVDPPSQCFYNGVQQVANCGLLKTYVLPDAVSWFALIAQIPFWFFMYMYLDSVVPNTYGISKHPLFCLRKKQTIEKIRASVKRRAHDPKVFSREDPI